MKKSKLVTQPNFLFTQEDDNSPLERPIQVIFWAGTTELIQVDGENENSVLIQDSELDNFIKNLKARHTEARKHLK